MSDPIIPLKPMNFSLLEGMLSELGIKYVRYLSLQTRHATPFGSLRPQGVTYNFDLKDNPFHEEQGKVIVPYNSITREGYFDNKTPLETLTFSGIEMQTHMPHLTCEYFSAANKLKELYNIEVNLGFHTDPYVIFHKKLSTQNGDLTENNLLSSINGIRTAYFAITQLQELESRRIADNLGLILQKLGSNSLNKML